MKIISSNFKRGDVKLQVETLDDLWYLNGIIESGDYIRGHTVRKIKIGGEDERKTKILKKTVPLKIQVDRVEFHKYSNILRVGGGIVECPEDIQKGSHHTFSIEENTTITLEKVEWLKFHRTRLEEAATEKTPKIMICVLDREEAYLAILKKFGYELLTALKGTVQKKGNDKSKVENFYTEVIGVMAEYDKKHNFDNIIVASPAFWKEELLKNLKDDSLKGKIVQATCSSVDEGAINEVLKRQEIQNVLKKDRVAREMRIVDELLTEISKKGSGVYGFKETENAAKSGAVKILIVSDSFLQKAREANKNQEIESVMRLVEHAGGEIHIISSEHDGGKKLDGLGGVGGILRYKMEY